MMVRFKIAIVPALLAVALFSASASNAGPDKNGEGGDAAVAATLVAMPAAAMLAVARVAKAVVPAAAMVAARTVAMAAVVMAMAMAARTVVMAAVAVMTMAAARAVSPQVLVPAQSLTSLIGLIAHVRTLHCMAVASAPARR